MRSLAVFAVSFVGVGFFAAHAAGCSSDSSPAAPADAGSDDATADVVQPDAADGGIEQDPNKYPADHQPIPVMKNTANGPVLKNPKVVTVTFAGDPKRDTFRNFDDTILTTPWWTKAMAGIGVNAGAGAGYAELAPTWMGSARVTIHDSEIQAMLQRGIVDGTIPRPVPEVIYAFYFPKNVTIQDGQDTSCQQFGAYHSYSTVIVPSADAGVPEAGPDGGDGGGPIVGTPVDVSYAVMPWCDLGDATATLNETTVSASHELAEASSDPYPGSGNDTYRLVDDDSWLPTLYYAPGSAIENGDACAGTSNWTEGNYVVQRIWSNAAAMMGDQPCQPVPAGRIYFAAAVRSTLQTVNGHRSYGYLFVKRGQSAEAVVNVFSNAALPHDLLFYVGVPKRNQSDPSDLDLPKNDITVQLSRQRGHNGNGAILKVSVPDTSATGDYPIVVRSVLEADDYNDWPLIVHVRP